MNIKICTLLLTVFIFISSYIFSQTAPKEIFYRDTTLSNGELMIQITEARSSENSLKCKIEIIHPLREYMIIKKNGISVSNENNTYYTDSDIELFPFRKKKETLHLKGISLNKGSLKLKFNNILISSDSSRKINIDSIKVPARYHEKKNYGDYSVIFTKHDKGKGIIYFQYVFSNNSNNICFFNHSDVKLTASGLKFEQYKPNPKPYIIFPKDSRTFTTKFYLPPKLKNKSFSLLLGDAAVESELNPLIIPGETILNIDYDKTSQENEITVAQLQEIYKPENKISDSNNNISGIAGNFTGFKFGSVVKPINRKLFSECYNDSLKTFPYTKTLPKSYSDRIEGINERVLNHIPAEYKNNNAYKNDVNLYIFNNCLYAKTVITNNNIYLNWIEMEEYLEKILFKTIPVDTIKKYDLKIFISNDPDENAYVLADGTILINAGYFANINNEAELATTISHEVSHYLNNDSFYEYIKAIQQYNRNDFGFSIYGLYTINVGKIIADNNIRHYSRECESNADLNGLKLSRNSDYDLYAGAGDFELFYHLEQKYSKRLKGNNRLIIDYTHPNAESRYYDMIKNIKQDTSKKLFLVDECLFYKLKQQSVFETLEKHLNGSIPYEALEFALNLYLKNPENQKYLFYVLESLRRITYREPYLNDEPVFINNYSIKYSKNINEKDNKTYLSNNVKDLLSRIFYIKPEDFNKYNIPQLFLDRNSDLITYKELFNRFSLKINKDTCTECLLAVGLKRFTDDENYYDYIKQYISAKDAKYKDVATIVLKNEQFYNVGNKELMVWDNWISLIGDENPRKEGLEFMKSSYSECYKYLSEELKKDYPEITTILNIDNKGFDISENTILNELSGFLFNYDNTYNEKINICLYNPEYYKFFHSRDIGKIHFLNVRYISNNNEKSSCWLSSLNLNRMKYQVVNDSDQREMAFDKDVLILITYDALRNNKRYDRKNFN